MKQLTILFLLLIAFTTTKAQTTSKPTYKKVIVVEVADYENLFMGLNEWERLCIHDPNMTAEAKVSLVKNLQAYKATIGKRIKLDSVLNSVDSTTVKPKSKKK